MGASNEFPITDHEYIPCGCDNPECQYCGVCHEQKCFHRVEPTDEECMTFIDCLHETVVTDLANEDVRRALLGFLRGRA